MSYHPDLYLNIELDGESHDSDLARNDDDIRDAALYGCGIAVLRFRNHRVRYELQPAVSEIEEAMREAGWYQAALTCCQFSCPRISRLRNSACRPADAARISGTANMAVVLSGGTVGGVQ